jgi:hypothetical protein
LIQVVQFHVIALHFTVGAHEAKSADSEYSHRTCYKISEDTKPKLILVDGVAATPNRRYKKLHPSPKPLLSFVDLFYLLLILFRKSQKVIHDPVFVVA